MATINDVAKLAGVSRGTVSNVINGAKVRAESKERVERAMAELGYVPNANARSLKTQKSYTVALVIPTTWVPFFSKLTTEIEEALRQHGYKLLLCISHDDHRREVEYVQMAQENQVDGILLVTYSDVMPYIKDKGIPLVAIERFFNDDIVYVSTDNYKGGALAAETLAGLGCKNLCFVGRKGERNKVAELRRNGFADWCRAHGVPFSEYYPAAGTREFVKELDDKVREDYAETVPYDGIFTAVDRYAEYIVDTLADARPDLVLGKDVQVVGFDGIGAHENQAPKVSSIRQPVEELARTAVDLLVRQINKEDHEHYVLLAPTFLPSRTTGERA